MEIIEKPYISELSKNRDNYRAWARAIMIMEDVVILYLISRPPQLGLDVMCICMHACMHGCQCSWGCDASCYDNWLGMVTQLLNFLNDASVVVIH